jgi:hypothetical protein
LSFLRKQESSKNKKIDSRFCGNDGLLDVSISLFHQYLSEKWETAPHDLLLKHEIPI